MRAFIAIPVPEAIRYRLEDLQDDLPFGRHSDPENFHITLAFLGEEPVERIEAAHEALEGLTAAPFSVRLDGIDVFGGANPRTIVAAVAPSEPLETLHRKVRSLLHGSGIMPERQRFRPHVTLARLGAGSGVDASLARFLNRHVGFATAEFSVSTLTLYRSTLGRDGAIHEPLADYPLLA